MKTEPNTLLDKLPKNRVEESFSPYKTPLSNAEAIEEASRCLFCYDAPCIKACPTEINIPQFIGRIATGNLTGAAKTILDSNIFGHSCANSCPVEVLCVGACVYNDLNKKPILIGKLQRHALESVYHEGVEFYHPGAPTGKRVACVGSGPASLACAHELRLQGHEVVVFEKKELPGGLNTSGIAPYKMKAQVSLQEIQRILKLGVVIEYGKELGRNLNLNTLLKEFDVLFLGLGLGEDSKTGVPGEEFTHGATQFISWVKTEAKERVSWLSDVNSALVVGGGNTALDVCRELKQLGISRVIVSYRRGEEDMSGYKHEFLSAREEGVEFLFYTSPTEYQKNKNSLTAKLLQKNPDNSGEVISVPVDLIIRATGQSTLEKLFDGAKKEGLQFEKGKLKVDLKTGTTGHPKIFAGGDLANGGMEVVNAVAEGKRAAKAICNVLSGALKNG